MSREPTAFTYDSPEGLPPAEEAVQRMLGLDPQGITGPAPERVAVLRLVAEQAQPRIDEVRTMPEPAPAHEIFEVLANPARHEELDGSGSLRGAVSTGVVSGVGSMAKTLELLDALCAPRPNHPVPS